MLPPPSLHKNIHHTIHDTSIDQITEVISSTSASTTIPCHSSDSSLERTSQISTPEAISPLQSRKELKTPFSTPPISAHHSYLSLSPKSSSPSPRRASSFSMFTTSPKSEYSPGNAFVLAVIDGNRNRNRSSNITNKRTPPPPPLERENNNHIPLVVQRTKLFNFGSGNNETDNKRSD